MSDRANDEQLLAQLEDASDVAKDQVRLLKKKIYENYTLPDLKALKDRCYISTEDMSPMYIKVTSIEVDKFYGPIHLEQFYIDGGNIMFESQHWHSIPDYFKEIPHDEWHLARVSILNKLLSGPLVREPQNENNNGGGEGRGHNAGVQRQA